MKKKADEQEAAAVWVSPAQLREWDKNPRKNDGEPVRKVVESIQRFGFAAPIVARKNGEIIAGHTRFKAAQILGLDKVPVRFLDVSEEDAHLLAIADNRLNEEADWDWQQLAVVLQEYAVEDIAFSGFDSTSFGSLRPGHEMPDFEPSDVAEQGQLDITKGKTCPNCGHAISK